MTRLILDEALRAKLSGVVEYAELCDESGRMLGFFVPAAAYDPALYREFRSPISDEEIERRRREPGGRTLKEIWARLDEL